MKWLYIILGIAALGAVAMGAIRSVPVGTSVNPVKSETHMGHGETKAEDKGTTESKTEGEDTTIIKKPTLELVPFISDQKVQQFAKAEQVIDAQKYAYQAVLETSKGNITLELFADKTPQTVNSFVFLALNHYYEGIVFHRVIPGFMAQTGDPTGTGSGGPGYQFGLELDEGLRFNKPGVLGMARTNDPNTNGSQFFITYDATSDQLSGQYTVWGQVLEGMDVVNAISKTEGVENPAVADERDQIKSVKIYRSAK